MMVWFKHYSTASNSNALTEILAETGMEGYGRYWRLLEAMTEKFDGENDTLFVFSKRDLKHILGIFHDKSLRKYLQCVANVGVMSFEWSDKLVRISSPILLELQGRDFKKARSERAEPAPKKENKKENKTKIQNAPNGAGPCVGGVGKIRVDLGEKIEEVYRACYPRKVGKSAGLKKLKQEIKSEEDLAAFEKAVEVYAKEIERKGTEKKYIKHFDTFADDWRDCLEPDYGTTSTGLEREGRLVVKA